MAGFELDDSDVYRNTKVFDQLLKFAKENCGNDKAIFEYFEDLVGIDLIG